jgi:hypothetical protein
MPNRWVEFVKSWATKNNTTYSCALSKPECSADYRKKFGVSKKIPAKQERETMGAEDINRAKKKPKKKPIKKPLIIESDSE